MRAVTRTLLMVVFLSASSIACDTRPTLSFSPETLPDAPVGVRYSAVITITGNQTPVFQISADLEMPAGLTLVYDPDVRGNRAELTGTPTTAGRYNLTISASCLGTNVNGQTGSHAYTLVVR